MYIYLKISNTGDWKRFGLALKLGTRFYEHFYIPGCLHPILASHSQLEHYLLCPSLMQDVTLTKQAKEKIAVKLGPSYDVRTAEDRQRKPSGNCCVQARESSFTNSFSEGCFVFKLLSHENVLFLE